MQHSVWPSLLILDNQLGDWEIFGVESQIEKYNGKITKGLYFVETDDYMLFNGNSWYSGDFIKVAKQESIQFTIKYQLLATCKLKGKLLSSICEGNY